jgi:hypothetical protein
LGQSGIKAALRIKTDSLCAKSCPNSWTVPSEGPEQIRKKKWDILEEDALKYHGTVSEQLTITTKCILHMDLQNYFGSGVNSNA